MVLRRAIFIQAATIAAFILIMFHICYADKCLRSSDSKKVNFITDPDRCFNFSVLNTEKKEFYSPNFPNHYPNNTKCNLRITADFGYFVQIDFLDYFKMENSPNCEYDRLVVRDGPYGYSQCKGVYCGQNFPPRITSVDRYLWLQFESDESIEYSGFRAVYKFVKGEHHRPQTEECFFQKKGPSGSIGIDDIPPQVYEYSKNYNVPIDCKWEIEARPNWRIYMTIPEFELEVPNDCVKNYIEIFDRSQDEKSLAKFCGTSAEPQTTASNIAYIRYFAESRVEKEAKFLLSFNTFRQLTDKDACDLRTEFDCSDRTCIDISLKCDEKTDCKYGNDEDATMCKKKVNQAATSDHMIIILVVFFILVITMCASISISCYNKVVERRNRVKEYKARKSKEASVEGNFDRTVGNPGLPTEAVAALQAAKASRHKYMTASDFPAVDDESSDSCHVPDVGIGSFPTHPNGGENIPRRLDSRSVSRGAAHPQYPYNSQSIESLGSDVAPTPPPVPGHRREPSQPTDYRVVAEVNRQPQERRFEPYVKQTRDPVKTPTDSRSPQRVQGRWPSESRQPRMDEKPPDLGRSKGISDPDGPRNAFLRGPLEAGAPRSPYSRNPAEIGLPKFGSARVNPDDGPRGPLARGADRSTPLATFKSPESYGDNPYLKSNRTNPYRRFNPQEEIAAPQQFRTQAAMAENSEIDSRPDSVDSSQSAPDVIANR